MAVAEIEKVLELTKILQIKSTHFLGHKDLPAGGQKGGQRKICWQTLFRIGRDSSFTTHI